MTPEHLMDAVGLLDDDLIQEAEYPVPQRARPDHRHWLGWAACLAVVLALGYGVTHIQRGVGSAGPLLSGGDPSSSYNGSTPPAQVSPPSAEGSAAGGSAMPTEPPDCDSSAGAVPQPSEWPAIMVDGVLYWSTGTPVPAEVDESAQRTVTGYINTLPETDGQTNFSQDLSARYALVEIGQEQKLVVLMNGEWILFDPVPPWER